LIRKYPYLDLNQDISALDGVPAVRLTDGSVLTFTEPHVQFIQTSGLDVDDIESGGWVSDGIYEASERSDTLRYKERMQAKKRMDAKRADKRKFSTSDDITESNSPHAERAVEVFGTTSDLSRAGFVLPSGQMPNLSEYGLPGVQHKRIEAVFEDPDAREAALRRMEGKELPCDVIAVLSTQEEMGPRNSKVTVHHIHPSIAIVMEGCPADDTFTEPYAIQTALKKGPMFRHIDVSALCAPRYQRWALDLAEKKGIPVQESVRQGGGNNAASIQTALVGAPSIVCGIPVRYCHTPNCISSYYDFEAAVQMVMALMENITPEMISTL
jgi:hypothetical protein